MKVIEYSGKIKNQDLLKNVSNVVSKYKGTLYISDKSGKPKGYWKQVSGITEDGVYFYITSVCKTGHQIWKLIKQCDKVILYKEDDMEEELGLKIHDDEHCELLVDGIRYSRANHIFNLYIDEQSHPTAYKQRLLDLLEEGMTVEEAKQHIATTPIYLELYYEKGKGVFAVECDYLEANDSIVSPYSGIKLTK